MLRIIYYLVGGFIILIYSAVNIASMFKSPPPKVPPKAQTFEVMRFSKGKYVYVPPRTNNYPGSSSGSSYPRSSGYSGGK